MEVHEDVLSSAREDYGSEAISRVARAAAQTEAAGYCRETRLEETFNFARRLGATHLGIACCVGLRREAAVVEKLARANGFSVSSVICKAGMIPKEEIGLRDEEKIRPGQFEALCNPVGQARLLAAAGTELNIVIGLCVGHDSLFFRHSEAPCTVLVAKDRVLGHNPCAAIFTAHSYYSKLTPSKK
jgi:uncharacterized metal-binding protein